MGRDNKVEIFMPLYVGDYDRDTSDLSFEEHGFYGAILRALWVRDGVLSTDPERLSRVLRTDVPTLTRLWPAVERFLSVSDDGRTFTQGRLSAELDKAIAKRQAASDSGKRGAEERTKRANTSKFWPVVPISSDPSCQTEATHQGSPNEPIRRNASSSESPSGALSLSGSDPLPILSAPPERAIPLARGMGPVPGVFRSASTPYQPGAITEPFTSVFSRYVNQSGRVRAAQTWQETAAGFPGGEVALARAVGAAFDAGLLKQHPFSAEHRYQPTFEKFMAGRHWEDPIVAAAARAGPKDVRTGHVRAEDCDHTASGRQEL